MNSVPPPGDPLSLAFDAARRAARAGEVPVGAVVVRDGAILGIGHNRPRALCDPTAHAEILAIREACARIGDERLIGCDLYVTLEPCPMCAGALLNARIGRLVFGAWDEKAGAVGSVLDVVRDRRPATGVEVVAGVRAAEAADLLRTFFVARRS